MTGLHLAQYRIDAEVGRGGMGIVYRATDTKLDRTVALKVLPPHALSSSEDRARFYREARAAAKLSHAHICHVYQVDEAPLLAEGETPAPGAEARPFIAMEYVDGESLAERIAKGPFKLEDVVRVASQVAEALGAAHEAGIVHRDVKSGNVMLTSKGEVKVLDFGLAKTAASTQLTRQGSTLGTIAYMSPEQARGEEVDGRTDLWALGVVLYEMIAGRRPFAADYEQATLYAILNEDPEPLTAVRTGVSMELERIVGKLLAKDRALRYQSASGLTPDLAGLDVRSKGHRVSDMASGGSVGPAARHPSGSRLGLVISVGLLCLFGGIAVSQWLLRPASEPLVPRQVSVTMEGLSRIESPGVSPDGRYLLFSALDSLGIENIFVYDFKRGNYAAKHELAGFSYPRFSPDGRWATMSGVGAGVIVFPLPDGQPRLITLDGEWSVWDSNETLLFRRNRSIYRISTTGGEAQLLLSPDSSMGVDRAWPTLLLPDGNRALIAVAGLEVQDRSMAVMDVETGDYTIVADRALASGLLKSGHLVYLDGGGLVGRLVVQAFDMDAARLLGQPVGLNAGSVLWNDVAMGQDGTFVFVKNRETTNRSRVYALDSRGRPRADGMVEIPDLYAARFGSSTYQIAGLISDPRSDYGRPALVDLRRSAVPFGVSSVGEATDEATAVVWEPGGKHFLVGDVGQSGRVSTIRRVSTDGSVAPEVLVRLGATALWRFDVRTGTGELIAADKASGRLVRIDLASGETFPLFAIDSEKQSNPSVSPDGRYVAYESWTESRADIRIVVRDIVDGGGIDVTPGGIQYSSPEWSPDGTALFVIANRNRIVRIPVALSPRFSQTGPGETVLDLGRSASYSLSVSPASDRLLVSSFGVSDRPSELRIIFNFGVLAKELAPTP